MSADKAARQAQAMRLGYHESSDGVRCCIARNRREWVAGHHAVAAAFEALATALEAGKSEFKGENARGHLRYPGPVAEVFVRFREEEWSSSLSAGDDENPGEKEVVLVGEQVFEMARRLRVETKRLPKRARAPYVPLFSLPGDRGDCN